jgi:phosphoribosyl-ATP pyrophosphohydrolase
MDFDEICALVRSRKREMPPGSATTALFEKGAHAIGKKLVEEAAESWMAARHEGREAVALELSQLLYYVACMMAETGVTEEEVYKNL